MTFAQIPPGTRLFVDANPLVYFFNADPLYGTACQQLMARIERQEIVAFTSTQELSDVAHRLMFLEAMDRFGWPAQGLASRLKRHPAAIQQLSRFRQSVDAVLNSRIQVLAILPGSILTAADFSIQHGLLSNDALIVAVMQAHGLSHLASQDGDFDRVTGLTRYAAV